MSITAFPVLAHRVCPNATCTKPARRAGPDLPAMDDVMGWCILAFVLAMARIREVSAPKHRHGSALISAATTVGLSIAYVLVMLFVVRRFLGRLRRHVRHPRISLAERHGDCLPALDRQQHGDRHDRHSPDFRRVHVRRGDAQGRARSSSMSPKKSKTSPSSSCCRCFSRLPDCGLNLDLLGSAHLWLIARLIVAGGRDRQIWRRGAGGPVLRNELASKLDCSAC